MQKFLAHETPSQRRTSAPHIVRASFSSPLFNTFTDTRYSTPQHNQHETTSLSIAYHIPYPPKSLHCQLTSPKFRRHAFYASIQIHLPIHDLPYGCTLTNSYVQIYRILRHTTRRPEPFPRPEPPIPTPMPAPPAIRTPSAIIIAHEPMIPV